MLNIARERRGRYRQLRWARMPAAGARPVRGSEQKVAARPWRRYQPPSYSETFPEELP